MRVPVQLVFPAETIRVEHLSSSRIRGEQLASILHTFISSSLILFQKGRAFALKNLFCSVKTRTGLSVALGKLLLRLGVNETAAQSWSVCS